MGKKMPAGLSPPDQAEMETYEAEGPLEIQTGKILNSLLPLTILLFRTSFLLTRGRILR